MVPEPSILGCVTAVEKFIVPESCLDDPEPATLSLPQCFISPTSWSQILTCSAAFRPSAISVP
jgi:hypothetical protein